MPMAHLAIDLGASSGRAIVGVLEGEPRTLKLEEVHRFAHHACPTPTGPVWDLTGIWRNLLEGLKAGAAWCRDNGADLQSIGVDTWGVDWVLIGRSGELLGLPHCYRDPQNEAACRRVLEQLGGFERLFERTGIQLLPFNTLFQLAARHASEPKLFEAADRLLFLPDLFHYWLSGQLTTERTIASTSSMLDVSTGDWDRPLLEQLGLPTHMLGPIIEPGTQVGVLREEIALTTGAPKSLRVIAPAGHDTASAVAAVPVTGRGAEAGWAYLSSGTWSLLGAELPEPLSTPAAARVAFTNERGVERTVRFLKNIAGLWLIQELQRELPDQAQRDFATLTDLAAEAQPFRTLVNPNSPEFGSVGDMANKLRAFARRTGQPEPETIGQLVRCCLESLALCYRDTANQLDSMLGRSLESLYIVGGGCKNRLLNQLTAQALGRPVECGPVEATAIGNVLVQALGCGAVANLNELRQIVATSFQVERFEPGSDDSAWNAIRTRYAALLAK